MEAYTIAQILGGMIGPIQAEAAVTATLNSGV